MNPSLMRGIGEYIASRYGDSVSFTAGGGADGVETSGAYVDRQDFGSAKMVVAFTATLGDGETLTLAANAQDATSSAGAGVADFGDAHASAVAATGGTGGSTETGTIEIDLDLNTANQYIRSQVTPTLSAATTDTCRLAVVWILGGATTLPAA